MSETAVASRGIRYWFPVATPLLLAACDFTIRALASEVLFTPSDVLLDVGVVALFGRPVGQKSRLVEISLDL